MIEVGALLEIFPTNYFQDWNLFLRIISIYGIFSYEYFPNSLLLDKKSIGHPMEREAIKNLKICTYLTSSSKIKIEFLVDNGKSVTQIEVKAKTNLKAKSLKIFKEKYQPNKSI